MFEAARRNLAAQKPSVDRLQLSQLGMSRRLLNPQLYELHDDLSEATWTTDSEQTGDVAEKAAVGSVDEPTSETVGEKMDTPELNGQSTSDQEEVWSDCAAELPPSDDKKVEIESAMENSFPCPAAKSEGDRTESELAGKTVESLKTGSECHPVAESGKEVLTASDPREPSMTNHVCTAATACVAVSVTETVAVTAAGKPSCAVSTKPTTTTTCASKTTACTTLLTTTTSSSKSERPRASPCRAALTKQTPPVTNGRDATKLPCKASSPAAAAKQSSSLSNAAAAKLLVDMVGRSKATSSQTPGVGGQCKLTQCVDKIHADPVSVAVDNGSCSAEKTSRVSVAAGTSNAADGKKDGGKFCECWHCEFFGHMSVS